MLIYVCVYENSCLMAHIYTVILCIFCRIYVIFYVARINRSFVYLLSNLCYFYIARIYRSFVYLTVNSMLCLYCTHIQKFCVSTVNSMLCLYCTHRQKFCVSIVESMLMHKDSTARIVTVNHMHAYTHTNTPSMWSRMAEINTYSRVGKW